MKKCLACFLITMLLSGILFCARAEGQQDWIENHFKVELNTDGKWIELEKMLYYSHENGRIADGFLMFSPILGCLETIDVPTAVLAPDTDYRVAYDSYVEEFSTRRKIYSFSDGNLEMLEDSKMALSDLAQGTYLVCIACQGCHRGEGYSGACFFWLIAE